MPGSTLFMPVCDVTRALISLIAWLVEPGLRRYAPATGGWNIVNDRRGTGSARSWRPGRGVGAEGGGASCRKRLASRVLMTPYQDDSDKCAVRYSAIGYLPRVSHAIRTVPREAARTRRACGIRTQ
jgi:hypothetical protein